MDISDLTANFSDLDALADAIEAIAPELRLPRPVELLGTGVRSTVMRDSSGQVYRVGRTPSVVNGYLHEVNLLPLIRNHLPVAIPEPRLLVRPSEQFPGGVMTYRGLPGHPISTDDANGENWRQLASELGGFLTALHQIPTNITKNMEFRP